MEEKSFSLIRIIIISSSTFSYTFMFFSIFALSSPLIRQLKFSESINQLFSSFPPICGAIFHPLIGFWSDRTKCKWGRRRPYILIGQIGTTIGIFLQVTVFKFINKNMINLRRTLFIISFTILNIFAQFLQAPLRPLIGDILPKNQQTIGNSVVTQLQGIGSVISSLIGYFLTLHKNNDFFKPEFFHPIFSLTVSIIGTILTLVFAKEKNSFSTVTEDDIKKKLTIKDSIKYIKEFPKCVFTAAIFLLFSWAAYYPFAYNATSYYAIDIYKADINDSDSQEFTNGLGFGMLMLAALNAVVYFSCLLNPLIFRLVDERIPIIISELLLAVVLFLCVIVNNKWIITVLFSLIGYTLAIFSTTPYIIVSLNVPNEMMGLIMGSLNIFLVIGQILSQVLICPFVASDKKWVKGRIGPVIAVGSPFAVLAAICGFFMKQPNDISTSDISESSESFQIK